MAANIVLHAKTAQSDKNKFASLTQEVVRRLLHTSRTLPSSHRMENLERFSQKMANSGHKPSYIKNVVIAGIEKYTRKYKRSILPSSHKEFKPLHLGTNFNTLGRWKDKMLESNNWYKDKNAEKSVKGGKKMKIFPEAGKERIETTTVVFVPPTRGGKLAEMLKEKEDDLAHITKFRVRYQEAGGTKLGLMFSTDLGAGDACGRQDCQPCLSRSEGRPNCKSQSILYESKCTRCNPSKKKTSSSQELPRKGIYFGESSRSLYERSREHLKDAADFDSGSHIVKHWMNEHPDMEECPVFSFSILSRFRDCLSRQVAEAITINYTRDQLLNSKNEYMANCLTRICVEETRFEKHKREREEEEKEEAEKQRLLVFKSQHLRPKRSRDEAKKRTDEPLRKRIKLFPKAGNPPDSDDLDLGTWIRNAEERCNRVGGLKTRMENEKKRILAWMDGKRKEDDGTVPEGWKSETTGGPSHLLGEGAPLDQINTRARDLRSQNQDDKPVPKGWKITTTDVAMESQDNSVSNGSELDGVFLDSSNESYNVPGNRDICRQDENPGRKAQMSVDEDTVVETRNDSTDPVLEEGREDETVPEGWKSETTGGPSHHLGEGAPLDQINTRACDLGSQDKDDKPVPKGWKRTDSTEPLPNEGRDEETVVQEGWKRKREERKKRKEKDICLTSLNAWWTRVEKEERKFYREVLKETTKREEEIEKKSKKIEDVRKKKETFIRKFFPNCKNSPGGTQKLLSANNIDSGRRGDMEKLISRGSQIDSAETTRKMPKLSLSRTLSAAAKINNKTSSHGLHINDGQSELITAYPNRPITDQDRENEVLYKKTR